MRKYFIVLAALLPALAYGQGTDVIKRGTVVQPELQLELTPNARSYVFVGLGGLRYSDYNTIVTNRTLGLDTRYLTAGYEQRLGTGWWSWGATLRVAGSSHLGAGTAWQPGLLLRHRSALGSLVLGQRLATEYALTGDTRLDPAYTLNSQYTAASRLLVRLRLDLYRQDGFQVADWLNLSPRISFEPALFLRLQRDTNDPDKRTIDFTALRADVSAYLPGARLTLTPWFAWQTQYYSSIIQFDAKGNPTSNGKLNFRQPTVGVEVRYNLSLQAHEKGSFALPTQH
jgi:hypothetical protein